jgi:hypothetical protein
LRRAILGAGLFGLGLLAVSAGCAGRRASVAGVVEGLPMVGVYRGRVETAAGEARRFRLMLYVSRPDRLHGEILGPFGGPQLIVDGGGGQLSVTSVRDRVAYVGPARPEIVRRVFGLSLSVEAIVRAVLDGVLDDPDYTLIRSDEVAGSLPSSIAIHSDDFELRMDLRRARPLENGSPVLGRGSPPPGMEVRPIEELESTDGGAILELGEAA